ncbi:HD domain-containing phosphohydrolase [Sessilibacter sp. MAH1]
MEIAMARAYQETIFQLQSQELLLNASILVFVSDPLLQDELKSYVEAIHALNVDFIESGDQLERMCQVKNYDLVYVDAQLGSDLISHSVDVLKAEANFSELPMPLLFLIDNHFEDTFNENILNLMDEVFFSPLNFRDLDFRVKKQLQRRVDGADAQQRLDVCEAKLLDRTRQLYETQLKLVEVLSRNLESRGEAHRHDYLPLVGQYAAIVSRAMGLSDDECDLLEQASPLHDLGNIELPDEVLYKSGPMTSDDITLLRSHVNIGARLLASQDGQIMQMAATIAQTHHERWDGTGYPSGLKGKEIPLCSRIVAVCDVFDALTSNRPYRPGWRVSKALEYLKSNAGRLFDPDVVNSFQSVFNEVLACRESAFGVTRQEYRASCELN